MRVFVGGSRDQRAAAVRAFVAGLTAPGLPALLPREIHAAAHWPFLRYVMPPMVSAGPVDADGPRTRTVLWLRDLHLAFPPPAAPGIRCVLTQSTYQLQRILDALAPTPPYVVVADADNRLRSEMSGQRGPWARIDVTDLGAGGREGPGYELDEHFADVPSCAAALLLHRATRELEGQNVDAARASVTQALEADPSWEAAHFERGKICLRTEDTEGAAAAFAEAGRLMPSFAAAFSNLGAALGEMDRSEAALAALEQALAYDPNGFPVVNNIGAVHREAGRLDAAETAFRRVIAIAPTFVFGHYNLGHTLFLAGRFDSAREAYEEGHNRDSQKNARQACRLAVARAAAGDTTAAVELIEAIGASVPPDVMRDLAGEMIATLDAGLQASVYPGSAVSACEAALTAVRRYLDGS